MENSSNDKIYYISVDDILPNRFQPRLHFDENELNELAESILKYGVIQPIVVRKTSDKYEIIAGERRYKAACLAGLKTIPAIVNNTDDNTSAEIALLENLQRKNLTVIEEAQSYKKLMDRGFTQDDIASKLGISQSSIANKLRLLNLPKEVRDALLYNQISERHARSLLSLNNEDLQKSLLKRIIDEKLTVKQTEDEISTLLMKDIYKNKQIDTINDNSERFIKQEPITEIKDNIESNNQLDEILDFKNSENAFYKNKEEYNNETKLTEIISNNENINPFLSNFSYSTETNNSDENNSISNYSDVGQQTFDNNKEIIDNYDIQNNYEINNEHNEQQTENNDIEMNKIDEINNGQHASNIESKNIDKIRDYLEELKLNDDSIRVTELDLDNKYKIIIEIDKNS